MHTLYVDLTTPALDNRPVCLTGNFCGWQTAGHAFQLQATGNGRYALSLPVDDSWPDPIVYKYYRGDANSFELDDLGGLTPDRTVSRNAERLHDTVPQWQWYGLGANPAFAPLEHTFFVDYPGSDQPRRVRVALPYDYETSEKAYPVLYLNDGQNLLGEGEGYGSWQTELRLAQLASRRHHEVIVVAIDHGGNQRIPELTVEAVKPGFGKGRAYLTFLVSTLKPRIDARYRTLADAAHTGIGGSSLGGLISVWAGLLHPGVFGRWLIFSPALWISPGVYEAAARREPDTHTRVYLYGGQSESRYMVPNLKRLQGKLRCRADACTYLHTAIDPNGRHEEGRWSAELPRAIEWLFFGEDQPAYAVRQPAEQAVLGG